MTEQDTYDKLRKTLFSEMYRQWYQSNIDIVYHEWLKTNGWKEYEFRNAVDQYQYNYLRLKSNHD